MSPSHTVSTKKAGFMLSSVNITYSVSAESRGFQKAEIGSNERKYCEDGLATKKCLNCQLNLDRQSRWVFASNN